MVSVGSIALELATLGSDIVVADVLDKNAEQVAEEIHALGRQAIPIRVDVTSRSDLDAMAAKAMSEFGRIDVLINNAGVNWFGSVLDVTEESWDFVMDVNAKAVFFASQAVLPHMFAAKKGSIVSLASMAGKLGSTYSVAYAASKAAVISITRSLALSGAPHGVRANCVCPGYINSTDMWRQVRQRGRRGGRTPDEINAARLEGDPTRPLGDARGRGEADRLPGLRSLVVHHWRGRERLGRPRDALTRSRIHPAADIS